MTDNVYIDIAIGLVFTYLLYSLLATAFLELLATFLNLRGKNLFNAVKMMLSDWQMGDSLGDKFFAHPLIKKLNMGNSSRHPSYIDPKMFGRVVEQILPDLYLGDGNPLSLEEKLKLLPEGEFKDILKLLKGQAGNSIYQGLETWYNMTMDRLSGSYKRTTQIWLMVIGFSIAAIFNVDSIAIYTKLSTDKEARDRIVAQAIQFEQANQNYESLYARITGKMSGTGKMVSDSILAKSDSILNQFNLQRAKIGEFLKNDLEELEMGIDNGWNSVEFKFKRLPMQILGWLLTALAISIGSPFWFDLLQKLVNLRGSGIKPGDKK